jgi:hypothetical protein
VCLKDGAYCKGRTAAWPALLYRSLPHSGHPSLPPSALRHHLMVDPHPSSLTPPLADLIQKRVVLFIIAMLLVLPSLEVSSGLLGEHTQLNRGGLRMLHHMALDGGDQEPQFHTALEVRGGVGGGRGYSLPQVHGPECSARSGCQGAASMHACCAAAAAAAGWR